MISFGQHGIVMVEEIAFMNCDFIWGEIYGVRWRKRS